MFINLPENGKFHLMVYWIRFDAEVMSIYKTDVIIYNSELDIMVDLSKLDKEGKLFQHVLTTMKETDYWKNFFIFWIFVYTQTT